MRDGEGARFLFRMAKAARKRNAGLTVITQDAADVLGTDLGLAVVANAATQILLRQAPQAIDAVADAFGLTAGEARLLLSAPRGEGLLVAGRSRIPFRSRRLGQPNTRLAVTGHRRRHMMTTTSWPDVAWVTHRPWLARRPRPWLVALCSAGRPVAGLAAPSVTDRRAVATIAAPPRSPRRPAAAFWTTLVGVLTPSVWRRRLYGTPHVGWEYTWTGRALTHPGLGARHRPARRGRGRRPRRVAGRHADRRPTAGGADPGRRWRTRWAGRTGRSRPMCCRCAPNTTPTRCGRCWPPVPRLRHREHACVQILARPAPARRVRAARRDAGTAGTARPDLASRAVAGAGPASSWS